MLSMGYGFIVMIFQTYIVSDVKVMQLILIWK